jgi:ParB family chromosome partitioning protein
MSHNSPKLGSGLSMLFGGEVEIENKNIQNDKFIEVPISSIKTWLNQPRTVINEEKLLELAESIKSIGILCPIVVRKVSGGINEQYSILAGERRYRAAIKAGLEKIPVLLAEKEISDEKAIEIALIENIQRENLNAIDEAGAYQELMNCGNITQEQLAKKIGKSRSHVTNLLRLLSLPNQVMEYIKTEKLSMGHARLLVGLENAIDLAEEIIKKQLSVRDVEQLLSKNKKNKQLKQNINDHDLKGVENILSSRLSCKVKILKKNNNSGQLNISYNNLAELDKIITILTRS